MISTPISLGQESSPCLTIETWNKSIENVIRIVKKAFAESTSLKKAALALGLFSVRQSDQRVK
jgi:fumarate hydratase class II